MNFLFKINVLFLFTTFICGCRESVFDKYASTANPTNPSSADTFNHDHNHSNVGRAIWQKPGLVIEKLGDISDKVIADIGAGTGYFSFRLAYKAKKVIAIEIEQQLLDYIDSTKTKLPVAVKNNIETRLATSASANLKDEEVDIILIINTIAYIPDLPQYLETIKKGLKKGGKIMIIDYKMKRLPINAPPKSERVYLDKLEDLLIHAGYKVIISDDTSLDYQYIIQATKN